MRSWAPFEQSLVPVNRYRGSKLHLESDEKGGWNDMLSACYC
jgi:hypothetical protein